MSGFRYPSVFLSHGTPMLAFGEDSYQMTLAEFAKSLPKPKAILFLSAHSVSSQEVHVLSTRENQIQHDFSGFPKELYEISYRCPGDPELAESVGHLLTQAGFGVRVEKEAPLDHGIWVPLLHMYPKGDVPVVRVSLPLNLHPAQILKLGKSLSTLRENGVLLIGSGGAVHNLRELKWTHKNDAGAEWARTFENWIIEVLTTKNVERLVLFEENPDFFKAHPTSEHFLPILFTVGAALPGDDFSVLYRGIEYESLSMLCFKLSSGSSPMLH